jgi:type II secretory pathway pseudopilin PulG
MVALVMMAMVYAIALPAIGRSRITASLHNAKQVVISSIFLARATAIRYGRPAVVRIDSDRDEVWVEADTTVAGTGSVAQLGYFSIAEEFDVDLKSERSALCFNSRGIGTTSATCPQPGGVIFLTLRSASDSVVVSPVGRVIER